MFELVKSILRNHLSVFQVDPKYIHNDIVNPLHVRIIHYDENVEDMHKLAKHILTPLMEGDSFESDNWKFHDNESSVHEI